MKTPGLLQKNPANPIKTLWTGLLLTALYAGCGGQSQDVPQIRVENVWSRPVNADGKMDIKGEPRMADKSAARQHVNGVVYLNVMNDGGAVDRLLRAHSDVAAVVEIHQTKVENDRMMMQKVAGGIEIPQKGSVELKPGGYHIMLIGLNRSLIPGDSFQVDLEFEKTGKVAVYSKVQMP